MRYAAIERESPVWPWLCAVLVAAVAVAVYANAVGNGYALDDVPIVQENVVVHAGSARDILLGPYWPNTSELYRPVTLGSFAVEWRVWGDRPDIFHVSNVLVHAVASVAAFALLLRLGAALSAALAGALIFAVHPVHVEAVANLVGRAELLATGFVLLACLVFLSSWPGNALRTAGVGVLYLLALGAKEIAISLPVLLLALRLLVSRTTPDRVRPWGAEVPVFVGLGAVLAGYLALRVHAVGGLLGTAPAPYLLGLNFLERLPTALRLWPEYLRLLFWPAELSSEWGPAALQIATWNEPLAWLGVLIVIALVGLAWKAWQAGPWLAGAACWLLLALLPVANLFVPVGVMLAERNLYLPSVAVAFLPAALVPHLRVARRGYRNAAAAGLMTLLVIGSVHSWRRTPVWQSNFTLGASLIESRPETYRAAWWSGWLLVQAARLDDALPYYERAMRLTRGNDPTLSTEYGWLLIMNGRMDEAEVVLTDVVRRARDVNAPRLLAGIYLERGEPVRALDVVTRARARLFERGGAPASYALAAADALERLGRLDEALGEVLLAAEIGNELERREAWTVAARLYTSLGRPGEAAEAERRAEAGNAGSRADVPRPATTEVIGTTGYAEQRGSHSPTNRKSDS